MRVLVLLIVKSHAEANCAKYEGELSIRDCFTKMPDGRTLNAAEYWKNQYSTAEDTKSESNKLATHITNVKLATKLQRGKMCHLTDEEVHAIVDALSPIVKGDFPAETNELFF